MGEKSLNRYWLTEAIRHLALALIGATGKVRSHIDDALETIAKHEKEQHGKNNDTHS